MQKCPTFTTERRQFGGLDLAVLALYVSDNWQDRLGEDGTWQAIEKQTAMAQSMYPEHFIAVEDGRCLGTDTVKMANRLRQLAHPEGGMAGIKYLTLVHNSNNLLGGSATDPANQEQGLTKIGLDVVDYCEAYGVLVDVSHASDRTIDDTLTYSVRPVIASHSGCRAVTNHPRNLTDTQITRIALSQGVVCVPFARRLVGTIAGIGEHIDHVCQVTGSVEYVGIGSDLDGAQMVEGIHGAENWSTVVVDGLLRLGYSDAHITQVAGGNLLRLFGEGQCS